jgi:hypothetical protein
MATLQTSRAVLRTIEAGNHATCVHCRQMVKFRAKIKALQVICNVYIDGSWKRVEHFHADCYEEAGAPYGEAEKNNVLPRRAGRTAAAASPAA